MLITELWVEGLPLPPSANDMYEPTTHKKWKVNRAGQKYLGVRVGRRASDELKAFQLKCLSHKNSKLDFFRIIRTQCLEWIKQGYLLRVDTWVAFEHSRLWTLDGQPKQLDADNRRKPLQDSLASILNIDDKWFFAGNIEKVTCRSKDLEQSVVRIQPHKARTLDDIKFLRSSNTKGF